MQPFTYSTQDVLFATGWTMNTFQSHVRREGQLVAEHAMSEARRGVPRRFTWRALIQFVVASEIIRLGMEPTAAFRFAAKVAFSGVHDDEATASITGRQRKRVAGYPFPTTEGDTFILIADGKMNIDTATAGQLELWKVPGISAGTMAFYAINFTELHRQTCERLEIDAAAQMREIYSGL